MVSTCLSFSPLFSLAHGLLDNTLLIRNPSQSWTGKIKCAGMEDQLLCSLLKAIGVENMENIHYTGDVNHPCISGSQCHGQLRTGSLLDTPTTAICLPPVYMYFCSFQPPPPRPQNITRLLNSIFCEHQARNLPKICFKLGSLNNYGMCCRPARLVEKIIINKT